MKFFLYNFLVPCIEILGIAILIGILLSIVFSVVIFGDRDRFEKEKGDERERRDGQD